MMKKYTLYKIRCDINGCDAEVIVVTNDISEAKSIVDNLGWKRGKFHTLCKKHVEDLPNMNRDIRDFFDE